MNKYTHADKEKSLHSSSSSAHRVLKDGEVGNGEAPGRDLHPPVFPQADAGLLGEAHLNAQPAIAAVAAVIPCRSLVCLTREYD